jgi:hypothetical protein
MIKTISAPNSQYNYYNKNISVQLFKYASPHDLQRYNRYRKIAQLLGLTGFYRYDRIEF